MKYLFLVFCITAPLYICAMEGFVLQPISYKTRDQIKNQDIDDTYLGQTFISFDQEIRRKHSKVWNVFFNMILTEEEVFEFINNVTDKFPTVIAHRKLLDKFSNNEDLLFFQVINYFIALARKNFDIVTYDTLATIQDATAPQSIPQLNKLPLPIKKYVMSRAYNNIKRPYTTFFTGHTALIRHIDVNARVNLAATTSDDMTFRLWDLATGKEAYTFPEKAMSGYVKFNDSGSRLATTSVHTTNPQEIHIKIWNTTSKMLLHTIAQSNFIMGLTFFQKQQDDRLLVFNQSCPSSKKHSISLYLLKKNKEPIVTEYAEAGPARIAFSYTHLGDYESIVNSFDWNAEVFNWQAQKNSRPLYLCEQAIRNTQHKEFLGKIKQTPVYESLTPLEKTMIVNKMSHHRSTLERVASSL